MGCIRNSVNFADFRIIRNRVNKHRSLDLDVFTAKFFFFKFFFFFYGDMQILRSNLATYPKLLKAFTTCKRRRQ